MAIPSNIFTNLSFLFATVAPNLLLLTSISSNKPAKSSSLSAPFAEFSILLKILSNVSFKFSSSLAFLHTLSNNSDGNIKNPFSKMYPIE